MFHRPPAIRRVCQTLVITVIRLTSAHAAESLHADRSDAAMVVCESHAASRVGRDIMMKGGNAVDAAVATAFALAVTWPEAGNIGGGGFMMIRPADGKEPVCIDYRETAPLSMNSTSFTRNDTTHSQKAVGVPGTVRGLAEAHRRYGKLPWKDLVQPAAQLARDGFQVDAMLAGSVNNILKQSNVKNDDRHAELRRVYGKPDGTPWQSGDRMFLADLAKTLDAITENANAFYTGRLAKRLIEEMKRGDGLISQADLSAYTAKVRPAMTGTFRGYTILGAPPPSSGGTCIIEALNILENFDLASRDRYDVRNVHLIAEAGRRVFADRARHLGDPDFTTIPDHLTSKEYAKTLAATIDVNAATPSEDVAADIPLADESPDTTHFSVIDADGMAVSNTYTLESSWGSRIVVKDAGYVLNNEMGDFNWFPGVTTRAGRIGTKPNQLAPGKRMLSSQSPSFVEKNGQLILITGSPGGRTIINTTLGVILNVTEFGMDVASAVNAPRQHHQWFPDSLSLEKAMTTSGATLVDALQAIGHSVTTRTAQGSAHSIGIDPASGLRTGVADRRRGGRPAAVSSGTLAIFDFSEVADSGLQATHNIGPLQSRWSADIADSVTDGKDQFVIRRDAPNEPLDSYLPLNSHKAGDRKISVSVKIDSASFGGQRRNEQLRIGFTQDMGKPQVTGRMIFGRNPNGDIVLSGEALGGGSLIPPVVLVKGSQLNEPIVMKLTLDMVTDTYFIESRTADSVPFQRIGTGKLAADRIARYLRLSALNDFSAHGEFVAIDRIVLQAL